MLDHGRFHLAWLLLAAAAALALRGPALGSRPMHADEAVHAARFRPLWQTGRFVYDPFEYHGPTLYYATLPAVWAVGPAGFAETTEADFRAVVVVFGVGTVLLVGLLHDALGRWAVSWAALLTAISPAMVFYSRYYIHETLLVFFTLAAVVAGWRSAHSQKVHWCLAAGACAGLVQATKETSVMVWAAMLLAWGAAALCGRWLPVVNDARSERPRGLHVAAGLATALLVAGVLFSSFFTNLQGPLDAVRTYLPWLERAGGQSPHVHPWYFYLQRLALWRALDGPWWTEGLILGLAAAGWLAAIVPRGARRLLPDASCGFVRWLGFYAVLLAASYSLIPYKTPWCLLGFLHALILLAGVGAAVLVRAVPTRTGKAAMVLVLSLASAQLAWQAYRASYLMNADPRNPYVYAHTSADMIRLAGDVQQLARTAAEGRDVQVNVLWDDTYYWPLPWYFRGLRRVGYWSQLPADAAAPLVVSAARWDAQLTRQLDSTHYMTGFYGVRPGVLAQLWVRADLWEAYLRRLGRLGQSNSMGRSAGVQHTCARASSADTGTPSQR